MFLKQAAGLAGDDGSPWDAVARTAAHLKRRGYIDWQYDRGPADPPNLPLDTINGQNLQRFSQIHVTHEGDTALATRKTEAESAAQFNFVNSRIDQFAVGNINNVDVSVIFDAAERSLQGLEASEDAKAEALGALAKMRQAASTVATAAGREALDAAVRQILRLP